MMMNLLTGLIAIILIGLFLGFMLVWVPALPLIIIVVSVMALLIYDVVQTVRFGQDYGRR